MPELYDRDKIPEDLQQYFVRAEHGLEATPEAYVEKLVAVFREVRRVLREDGTLWLNLGDSYAANRSYQVSDQKHTAHQYGESNAQSVPEGLKPKDLVGIPWRVAFALQADGWWLRSDIVWHKPNPMPESVTDRPTKAHEYIFLLSKSERYYYDHEAIKEGFRTAEHENYPDRSKPLERGRNKTVRARAVGGGNEDRGNSGGYPPDGGGRNKRSVWTVTTKPFPDAHFAVYPPDLIMPCIKAGTSERGACSECGAPMERVVDLDRSFESGSGRSDRLPEGKHGPDLQGGGETKDVRRGPVVRSETVGWEPACDCDADTVPCLVLDPFCGAGTTGVVCTELGRRFLGVELNGEYAEMARQRIMDTNPSLFREAS